MRIKYDDLDDILRIVTQDLNVCPGYTVDSIASLYLIDSPAWKPERMAPSI